MIIRIYVSDGKEMLEVYVEKEIIHKIVLEENYPLADFEVLDRDIFTEESPIPKKLEVNMFINEYIF